METVHLGAENIEEVALRAATILRSGGVVLYPTDTLYGLGADALSDQAVAKIYDIKGRDEHKPMHGIVADIRDVEMYAQVTDAARSLAAEFWPGALTIIFKNRSDIDSGIILGIATIGIRIPDNALCLALARAFGKPITATSANRSGEKAERSVGKILQQLGASAQSIDLIIDAGELPESKPSTVVDVSGLKPVIVREGVIPSSEIRHMLGI